MSVSLNIHRPRTMRLRAYGAHTWLEIITNDGANVGVFMPRHRAEALARAWAETEPAKEAAE